MIPSSQIIIPIKEDLLITGCAYTDEWHICVASDSPNGHQFWRSVRDHGSMLDALFDVRAKLIQTLGDETQHEHIMAIEQADFMVLCGLEKALCVAPECMGIDLDGLDQIFDPSHWEVH